jgi:hypothetical protein
MWKSITFQKLAKGSLIASGAIAKGYRIPFRVNCVRNLGKLHAKLNILALHCLENFI